MVDAGTITPLIALSQDGGNIDAQQNALLALGNATAYAPNASAVGVKLNALKPLVKLITRSAPRGLPTMSGAGSSSASRASSPPPSRGGGGGVGGGREGSGGGDSVGGGGGGFITSSASLASTTSASSSTLPFATPVNPISVLIPSLMAPCKPSDIKNSRNIL